MLVRFGDGRLPLNEPYLGLGTAVLKTNFGGREPVSSSSTATYRIAVPTPRVNIDQTTGTPREHREGIRHDH